MESVRSIALTLPSWIYRAIIKSENVLTLDREYFLLTGGLDRALYRIARKHAGSQAQGWTCTIAQLHKKTGSESVSKKFAEMLRRVVKANKLPRYQMTWTTTQDGSAAVHFVDRAIAEYQAEEKRRAGRSGAQRPDRGRGCQNRHDRRRRQARQTPGLALQLSGYQGPFWN